MRLYLLCFLALTLSLRGEENREEKYRALVSDQALSDPERLEKLFAIEWERAMIEYPEFASSIGYPGRDHLWTDQSMEAIQRRKAHWRQPLAVIESIDRGKLPAAAQLNFDLFQRDLLLAQESEKFSDEFLAISQLGGVHQSPAQTIEQMPKAKTAQYENILARLRGLPAVIDQNVALLRAGLKAGITPPRITLREVPAQILNSIPDDSMKSPLLRAFVEITPGVPEPERLRAAAVEIYMRDLVPAYRKLHAFVESEYRPGARASIAWADLPDGVAWYALNARHHTTTTMTPREIHDLGLREVKRIREEMDTVIAEVKFTGTFGEFTAVLRNDPRFFYTSADELLRDYREIAKRIDPELARLFGKLPRLPYGIKPVPAYAAESQPTAYYEGGSAKAGRPGIFFANTSKLPSRPKWQMEALTLHEAVPGHHLQISLAQEMGDVPEFRKYGGYTAYIEGWGLYAESLGSELGLYRDPYARFGALSYEMWRACRLVVDTGLHAFGWSREQAIDYMKAHTGKDTHEATVEIDRYLIWPGQALAYKIGQLKIAELRRTAESALGEKFDVRAFHDELLAHGALPLETLEALMKRWLDSAVTASRPQTP